MIDDIEDKTDRIIKKDIKSGKEYESLQEAQGQLFQIQEARKNNIQNQRIVSMSELKNNQILSQAGAMVANAEDSQQTVSPATQNILGKYGVSKPQIRVNKSNSVKVTPQNIVYNNNTTNIVNNPPIGPVDGRGIVINTSSQNKQSNTEKFKVWLNNIFSKQKEESLQREKEFQKQEWSLSRSANKIIRKIESIGTTVVERLDPRRVGSTVGNQLKNLLFIFGVNFLSKNWIKILNGTARIEKLLKSAGDYFGFSEKARRLNAEKGTGFTNSIKTFFGGTKNESLRDIFSGLFKEGVDYFSLKMENFFEERGRLMKAIKFPDLNLNDLVGSLQTLGNYIGDLLTTMVSGKQGIYNSVGHSIQSTAIVEGDKYYYKSNEYDPRLPDSKLLGPGVSVNHFRGTAGDRAKKYYQRNTDTGALALVKEQEIFGGKTGYYRGLLLNSLDEGGRALNEESPSATIAQSLALTGFFEDAKENNKVNVAGFTMGYERLAKNANQKGKSVVARELLNRLYSKEQIDKLINSGEVKPVKYKIVRLKKSDEYLEREGYSKTFGQAFGKEVYNNNINRAIFGNSAGNWINSSRNRYNFSNIFLGDEQTDIVTGTLSALDNSINRALESDYYYELVPESYNEPAVSDERFTFYEVKPEVLTKYPFKGRRNENGTIDIGARKAFSTVKGNIEANNRSFVEASRDILEEQVTDKSKITYDYNINEFYKELDEDIAQLERENEAEEENFLNNTQYYKKFVNNVEELGKKAKNTILDGLLKFAPESEDIMGSVKKHLESGKSILNEMIYGTGNKELMKERALFAMNRLMKEFGLTPTQAAGLVGNWIRESHLDPSQYNKENGGEGAVGIAQWRDSRIRAYEHRLNSNDKRKNVKEYDGNPNNKKLKDSTFEEQLDYAIWELKNTHTAAIEDLKKVEDTDVNSAADIGFGKYEFSAGLEGAINEMDKYSNKEGIGWNSAVLGRSYAKSAYYLYNKTKDSNYEYTWEDFDKPVNDDDIDNEERERKAMEEGKSVTDVEKTELPSAGEITNSFSPNKINLYNNRNKIGFDSSKFIASTDLTPNFELNVNSSLESNVKTIAEDIKAQYNALNTLSASICQLTAYAASTGNSISVTNQSTKTSVGSLLSEDYTNGIA